MRAVMFSRGNSQTVPLPHYWAHVPGVSCRRAGYIQAPGLTTSSSFPTGDTVVWILPFTSGGFLYIALVNVLPDLLEENDPW